MTEFCLDEFDGHPPATREMLASVEAELGMSLPQDYADFMLKINGGEGFVGGEEFIRLWKLEELGEFNRGYEVEEFCPGLLLFGTNGGGEAFGFDIRVTPWRVVQVPFMVMEESAIEELGNSFSDFLNWAANENAA